MCRGAGGGQKCEAETPTYAAALALPQALWGWCAGQHAEQYKIYFADIKQIRALSCQSFGWWLSACASGGTPLRAASRRRTQSLTRSLSTTL